MTICKACENARYDECTVICKDGKICECYVEKEYIARFKGELL